MIHFRCWHCNRYWRKPATEQHSQFVCRCGESLRVPEREGGSSQPWTFKNWLIRATVYGGFCSAMGILFGYLHCYQFGAAFSTPAGALVLASFIVVPGLVGFFGGERAVNFLARLGEAMARSGPSRAG
jgi:hypothetical protein